MFKIKCWWHPREYEIKKTVVKVAIICSNCGKETIIDRDNMNTNHQDIITTFLLNTMLQHVGMLCLIENQEHLTYDMDIQNSDWMTGGPWYKSSICKKLHENIFEGFIMNAGTDRYHTRCSIFAYEKKRQ